MANMNDWLIPVLTFLGTIFAGAGLKWIEGWLKKAKDKDDTATNLRNELRGELTSLKSEIQQTEKELDEWKGKYYLLIEQYLSVRSQLETAKSLLNNAGIKVPEVPALTPAQVSATMEPKITPE